MAVCLGSQTVIRIPCSFIAYISPSSFFHIQDAVFVLLCILLEYLYYLLPRTEVTSMDLCIIGPAYLVCQQYSNYEAVTHQPKDLCLVHQRQKCWLGINNCPQILRFWKSNSGKKKNNNNHMKCSMFFHGQAEVWMLSVVTFIL